MKTWLAGAMLAAVRELVSDELANIAPLCCEAHNLTPEAIIGLIEDELADWGQAHFLCFLWVRREVKCCIVDRADVVELLRHALETEDVTSFVDLTTLGGCSIDFSPEGDGVELLLTAWGRRESSARNLAQRLGVEIYTGKKPAPRQEPRSDKSPGGRRAGFRKSNRVLGRGKGGAG